MRILHLVHQYLPDYVGGTELYTQTLATLQAATGHDVAVFCPSPESVDRDSMPAVSEQGVRVFRIPLGPRSRTQVFRDTFRQPQLLDALRAILQQESPEIVHIQHLMGMPVGLVDLLVEMGILQFF